MKTATQILTFTLVTSMLTACHENPLKTHSKTKSVEFLIETSHQAEKGQHLAALTERSAYFACMRGKETNLDCNTLFDAMVIAAKDNKDFGELSRADLTDKAGFAMLEERYEEMLFNTLFED